MLQNLHVLAKTTDLVLLVYCISCHSPETGTGALANGDQSANMPPAVASTFLTHDTTTHNSPNLPSSAEPQHVNKALLQQHE